MDKSKGKTPKRQLPPAPPVDLQAALAAEKAEKVRQCEVVLQAALEKYQCALVAHQEFINGVPQAMTIRVVNR